MNGDERAKALLVKADEDLRALNGMLDVDVFTDEIFGFHVQQAVEKAFKAWISFLGHDYPFTHDLRDLIRRLLDYGADANKYLSLIRFNIYAVLLRYIPPKTGIEPVDRPKTIEQVRELIDLVGGLIEKTEE
jgi:HEPN domain-containing protein